MCGIAGIVAPEKDELGVQLYRMLQAMQHRGPDGAGYALEGSVERKDALADLSLRGKSGCIALGHVRLAITGHATAIQPFQSEDGRLTLLHNGEIYNHRELHEELNRRQGVLVEAKSDSEVILRLLEDKYDGDLSCSMKRLLPKLDGVYALAVTDNQKTVIVRDKIGVRQIYFSKANGHFVFASEKKPLIALGELEDRIRRLMPGEMVTIDGAHSEPFRFWTSEDLRSDKKITQREEALKAYDRAIRDAVRKRVEGRKHVGVIFSGGIDSLLIAYLIQQAGVPLTCYTAGRKGASDLEWAERLAKRFGFPVQTKMLDNDDIKAMIPEIIRDIEDHSLNQVEVAVPVYASVRMAQEAGERVILSGQGADELFGGYPWYAKIAALEGYESFERYSWEDAFLLYKECLEREDKIAMAHSLEPRVPFLDQEVVKTAFEIAPALKLLKGEDPIGKRLHRQYCVSIGIPEEIAFRGKEAAQHGANVHDAFEEIALKRAPDAESLKRAGYDVDKSVTEKLGSSSRYGYRYGDGHLWKPSDAVQYYLDSVAAGLGLLRPNVLRHYEVVTRRLNQSGNQEASCQ